MNCIEREKGFWKELANLTRMCILHIGVELISSKKRTVVNICIEKMEICDIINLLESGVHSVIIRKD